MSAVPEEERKPRRGSRRHELPDVPPTNANPDPSTLPPYPTFTQTEARILNVLADGMPHFKRELIACLHDDQADKVALWWHLSSLRKKIRPYGGAILCVFHRRKFCYQRVRLYNR